MLRFLITAGPTREYLDPVRFLTNASTGRMGYACARTAAERGHNVTLISGPVNLAAPDGVTVIPVVSTQEMADATLLHFDSCDCVIMTAAPCDYRPKSRSTHKMKKDDKPLSLEFERTPDILAELGRRKKNQILIGFAVEDTDPIANAQKKLKEKNLDAIILNSPASFAADTADFTLLIPTGQTTNYPATDKKTLAQKIISLIESLRH